MHFQFNQLYSVMKAFSYVFKYLRHICIHTYVVYTYVRTIYAFMYVREYTCMFLIYLSTNLKTTHFSLLNYWHNFCCPPHWRLLLNMLPVLLLYVRLYMDVYNTV